MEVTFAGTIEEFEQWLATLRKLPGPLTRVAAQVTTAPLHAPPPYGFPPAPYPWPQPQAPQAQASKAPAPTLGTPCYYQHEAVERIVDLYVRNALDGLNKFDKKLEDPTDFRGWVNELKRSISNFGIDADAFIERVAFKWYEGEFAQTEPEGTNPDAG